MCGCGTGNVFIGMVQDGMLPLALALLWLLLLLLLLLLSIRSGVEPDEVGEMCACEWPLLCTGAAAGGLVVSAAIRASSSARKVSERVSD